MNKTKILCTICARGGSKGIKNKNLINISGKPLISFTIEQAISSNIFDKIVLSSDSDEIITLAKAFNIDHFIKRNKALSNDKSGKLDAIKDAHLKSEIFFKSKFDYIIDLDVTSPLRNISDICDAFKQFVNNDNDNLFSVTNAKKNPYFNLIQINEKDRVVLVKKNKNGILRRQDAPKCYEMNASIYIWKRNILKSKKTIFLKNTGIYIMPEERSIDIDSMFDYKIVKFLLENKNAKK